MFKSNIQPIVIPQYEHGRQAGILASLWGNEHFDRPALDFDSFVKGVMFHDRGYGPQDKHAIMETAEETWLALERSVIEKPLDDASADILILMHIKRLAEGQATPGRQVLANEIEQQIQRRLKDTSFTREQHRWADRITSICDKISFDFCFGTPTQLTRRSYPHVDNFDTIVELTHRIEADGVIRLAPWPLHVPSYEGMITGYELEGYPERLEPVLVKFRVVPI
jgi:hypothetical protein